MGPRWTSSLLRHLCQCRRQCLSLRVHQCIKAVRTTCSACGFHQQVPLKWNLVQEWSVRGHKTHLATCSVAFRCLSRSLLEETATLSSRVVLDFRLPVLGLLQMASRRGMGFRTHLLALELRSQQGCVCLSALLFVAALPLAMSP